jgi:hypothetical protein
VVEKQADRVDIVRSRSSRLVATTVIVSVTLAVAGGTGFADTRTTSTKPAKWAHAVCVGLQTWAKAVKHTSSGVSKAIAGQPHPASAREKVLALLATAQKKTATLQNQVRKIGDPAVPNGAGIGRAVRGLLVKVVSALSTARTTFSRIPTTDAKRFVKKTHAALAKLSDKLDRIVASLSSSAATSSAELFGAFSSDAVCQKLASS